MVAITRSKTPKHRKVVDFSAAEIASAVAIAAQHADAANAARAKPRWSTWQTDMDIPDRRRMIQKIYDILRAKKPTISLQWSRRLPDLVRRLEECVYRHAVSKEEYNDVHTLEERLQHAATRILRTRSGS